MATRNLYQVLGLVPGVDREKIKVAFWALAKQSHPDVNTDSQGTDERFKEFNRAYEILGNPGRRASYDLVLRHEYDRRRRRFRQATATMLVTFIATIGAGSATLIWLQRPLVPPSEMSGPVPASNSEVASRSPDFPQPDYDEPALGYQATSVEMPAQADTPDVDSAATDVTTASADPPEAPAPADSEIPPAPGLQRGIDPRVQVSLVEPPKEAVSPAVVQSLSASKLASWTTYRNIRFGFMLKYPGDVFLPREAAADGAANMWVSRDGRSVFHITAALNAAGTKAVQHRRLVMQQRYGAATLDYAPVRANWFVLSGTLGEEMFYERTTFSCDGRSMHSWQLVYPVAERAFYDRVVEEIHRSYRHGARCNDDRRETVRSPKAETNWPDMFQF